jgi:hypothetical protein
VVRRVFWGAWATRRPPTWSCSGIQNEGVSADFRGIVPKVRVESGQDSSDAADDLSPIPGGSGIHDDSRRRSGIDVSGLPDGYFRRVARATDGRRRQRECDKQDGAWRAVNQHGVTFERG